MVLVIGGTGFVGRALLRLLVQQERETACLVRPSNREPYLPRGRVRIITGTLQDLPSLHVAMDGVESVVHLAGVWRNEGAHSPEWISHQGTANLVDAALDADVKRIVYLSHIHADRNSAYPLLRGKGAAEEAIRSSGLHYTILRSSLIFGPSDHFTTVLAMLIKAIPILFPVVGGGKTRFQPIHVNDVAACLAGCLDASDLEKVTLPIGGPQHLSYTEILNAVKQAMRVRRVHLHVRMPVMRALVGLMGSVFPNPPVSKEQLDLFSVDNTTELGSVPRNFGFEPQRFTENLSYLKRKGWRRTFLRHMFRQDRSPTAH